VTIALRELRRRPGRFVAATAILGALAVLLVFLGALLDGLLASTTGAYRAQRADVVVYSAAGRDSLPRSRIDPAVRAAVESAPGVQAVGGLGSVQLGARPSSDPASRDLTPTALIGYELAPRGLPAPPPAPGEVVADEAIRSRGFDVGDVLLLGPARTPVEIVGLVRDTQYSGQVTLWASLATWRSVTAANRPDLVYADGVVQALVARTSGSTADVDRATDGATATRTIRQAVDALPGVEQQRATFNQIIGVTTLVAVLVIALFFALITVERTGLYGVLKAVGASTGALFAGVAVQALVIGGLAALVGLLAAAALDVVIPPGTIPFSLTAGRMVVSAALLLAAAVLGSAFSLRRIVRVDPATAIGAAQ
jgi:putative ABC transport system permease protein